MRTCSPVVKPAAAAKATVNSVDPGWAALLAAVVGVIGGLIGYSVKARLDRDLAARAEQAQRQAAEKEHRASQASKRLDQQWANVYKAAEWVISDDEQVKRLGTAHLIAIRDRWTNDEAVRAFAVTTIQAALAPLTTEVLRAQAYGGAHVVQTAGSPQPELPGPQVEEPEGDT